MRPLLSCVVLGVALLVGSCGSRPRTQIMVELRAEPQLLSRLTHLSVRAQGFDATGLETGPMFERSLVAPLGLPLSLAIVPRFEDATRTFVFEAVGRDVDGVVIVVRARSGFVLEQTRRLSLVLEEACLEVSCADTQTCRAGRCEDAGIDAQSLPPFVTGPAGDAGGD